MFAPIAPQYRHTPEAEDAEEVLRKCVHCGFCLATCPTYQVTGDELDSPRGRIYLMKNLFEGQAPGARIQHHLDRCLTCRACESTCPSGVRYSQLVSSARSLMEQRYPRSPWGRIVRYALRRALGSPSIFSGALKFAQTLRPVLPEGLKTSVPRAVAPGLWPPKRHARCMIVLDGCVQSSIDPSINAALARILDRLGVSLIRIPRAGCCGALPHHTGSHGEGVEAMQRNIDAWWPAIQDGAEAIITTASGCGSELKEMGQALKRDPIYAQKAATLSLRSKDVSEVLAPFEKELVALVPAHRRPVGAAKRIVYHPPCSLQHGQQVRGKAEALLTALGYELQAFQESHLCCGSAGSYSLLQKSLASTLKLRKLGHLLTAQPNQIATANIGCQVHLQSGTAVPVRHWITLIDDLIDA